MRGSRLSEAHRHPPGNADADAWNPVAGTEVEGGVGGERRSLSRQLGVPTDRQYRRFSDSETQRARMTRRPFFAMDFNRHGHEIAFAPRQERSGGRSWMVGRSEVNRRTPPTGYRYRYATLMPPTSRKTRFYGLFE